MDNRWSSNTEKMARKWAETVVVMRWLHYDVAMWYNRINYWLGIPTFFFVNAMGTSLVGSALAGDDEISRIITWICAVISFITAGLIGVLFYVDPGTVCQRHLDKSVMFDDIMHDLQLELAMSCEHRQDATWFFQFIQRKISVAAKQNPVIPARFWNKKYSDVMNGHLSRELKDIRLFMDGAVTTAAAAVPPNNADDDSVQQFADKFFVKHKIKSQIDPSTLHPHDIPSESSDGPQVVVEMEDVISQQEDSSQQDEEHVDVINCPKLHEQLQLEQRKLRATSKQKRYEYQMNRIQNGDSSSISHPPDINKL